jgi:hypothetical protein
MKILLLIPTILLAGCFTQRIAESEGMDSSRFDPAQRLSPTAFVQNATMKDTSVHEDPNLLRAGVSRDQIAGAFGKPNETSTEGGKLQDVYEFNPDGSKFVKPKVYARDIAAGVFSGGIATVVHQARIHHAEQQLTVYRISYGADGIAELVKKESREAPEVDSESEQSAPAATAP